MTRILVVLCCLVVAITLAGCASSTEPVVREPGIELRPENPRNRVTAQYIWIRSHWPPPPVASDLLVVDQFAIRSETAWESVAGKALLDAGLPPASTSAFRDTRPAPIGRDPGDWSRFPDAATPAEPPVFHVRYPVDLWVENQRPACTVTFTPDRTVSLQHRFTVTKGDAPETLTVRWRSDLETDPEFDERGRAIGTVWKRASASADETFSIRPGQSVVRRIAVDPESGAELVQMLHMADPSECIGITLYQVDPGMLAGAAEGLTHPMEPPAGGWRASVAAGEAARLLAKRLDKQRDDDYTCISSAYHNGLLLDYLPAHGPKGSLRISPDLQRSGPRRYFVIETESGQSLRLPFEPDMAMILRRNDGDDAIPPSRYGWPGGDLLVVTRGHAGAARCRAAMSSIGIRDCVSAS